MTDTADPRSWTFESSYVAIPIDDIDTDQIIPARFLTTTARAGLGPHAFHDRRYRADGTPDPDFALNRSELHEARVLVAGRNFGCGSSREHAVWALVDAGFRAVVSTEFADIFRANALGNGLLPIQVSPEIAAALLAPGRSTADRVHIDLEARTLTIPDGRVVQFPVPPFARHCLLHGVDELGFLLEAVDDIAAYEGGRESDLSTLGAGSAARPEVA
ncbi:MAG TPA: 3-isopropylmalate dehydratase small subunit [Gemmatimonadaceae bacterium]|nr:3-isopropylmalate dehydratase small subunit [Gemmatimonadaceae bacterium]